MKSKLIIAALTITLCNQTWAAITFGTPDCGQWINETFRKEANKTWLLGFMSGLNANRDFANALGKINSANQIFLWMDNYCKANPPKTAYDGGWQLMFELESKK